jgi:hypothetical protein
MMIQDKTNKSMREMHINVGQNNLSQGGAGHGVGNGISQGVGHGLMQSNAGRYRQNTPVAAQHNMGYMQEMIMAMPGNQDQSQIEPQAMICYNCGQFGH